MTDATCYAGHIRILTDMKLLWENLETLQAYLLALNVLLYTFYCKRQRNKVCRVRPKVNSIWMNGV